MECNPLLCVLGRWQIGSASNRNTIMHIESKIKIIDRFTVWAKFIFVSSRKSRPHIKAGGAQFHSYP